MRTRKRYKSYKKHYKSRKSKNGRLQKAGRKSRERARKKVYSCFIEPVHKFNRETDKYETNYKIIDGTRVYYTKHFDKNSESVRILENFQRENPNKCMAFARMEDHILNQQKRAVAHLNKFKNCKIGDKLSYKVTILSGKMTNKLDHHFPHHQILLDDIMRCQ